MFDETTASLGGEVLEKVKKPPTRAQKVAAWRKAHQDAYNRTCHEVNCTCTPTRAQALILAQWDNPPIDFD